MGLDMYLYLRKYESIGQWDNKETKDFYPKELKELEDMIYSHNFLSKSVRYQVAYWRKENAIHNWFVQKCANGVDECQDIYVSEKQLQSLLKTCEEVVQNPSKANELLPTCNGFFFGSDKYDEWYFEGLKYTIEVLQKVIDVIKQNSKYDCIYHASW